ncbi:MAG: hypothetical protein K2G32_06750 [Oscillospiraceae bacterium]|nr:hypothetical protein [Oscillospiraceae bacterium]
MKKVISFVNAVVMLVLCVFLMAACSDMNISQNDEEFCIVIHQDTESAIYGVHCEYYLEDTPIGGTEAMIMENGNVIPIEPGGTIRFPFIKQGFPENADLSALLVKIYVIHQSGNETKTENDIELSADYGNEYDFSLSGSISDYYISEMQTG